MSHRDGRDQVAFPRIMVLVPRTEWAWTESTNAIQQLRRPPGSLIIMNGQEPGSIANSRNRLAEHFVDDGPKYGCDYGLFVDSDMTPAPDTALRLLRVAQETGAEIVSAICTQRRPPFSLELRLLPGQAPAELRGVMDVARVGFGCVLVHRRAFERMARPWFEYTREAVGRGEDWVFCEKARALGMRIVVDVSTPCGHLAVIPMTPELAEAWQRTPTGERMLRDLASHPE